jgi:hypothetical protein
MLEQMNLGDYNDSRKLPEKKWSQCIVCSTKERRWRARTVHSRYNKELHGECFLKQRCQL